jgi:endonuclease/exonuclease/phosphatase family metal-dependent hydrolase
MRLVTIIFAITCALVSGDALARPLRVLTYNIHHAEGRDGIWDLQRLADVVNSVDPDLVALQEVDQGTTRSGSTVYQLHTLAHLTGMRGIFGRTINLQGGQYGNGVLVASDLTVLSIANHSLPNPANGEQRGMLELELSYGGFGGPHDFTFLATHLDHSSSTNRAAQVGLINSMVANSTTPAILAGDYNFRPTSAEYAQLSQEWQDPTADSPGTSPSLQIDFVTYRGPDQWQILEEGAFIVNATTAIASDHYPLLAVLELLPKDADFNDDGIVDGIDFLIWQREFGATGPDLPGDANHDRKVDADDLAIWSEQYGSGGSISAAVPEPTAALLFVGLALSVCRCRCAR